MIDYHILKVGVIVELKPINQKAVIISDSFNNHTFKVRTDKNEILYVEDFEINSASSNE